MKKRILFILKNLQIGGVQKFVLDIYNNIDKDQFDIFFAVENIENIVFFNLEKDLNKIIFQLPNHSKICKYRSCLKKLIKKLNIDTVHIHMNFLSYLPLSCCGKRIQKITHAHASYPASSFIAKMARSFIRKYIRKKSDVCLACSVEAGHWLYGKNNFITLYNGVDEEKYKFRQTNRVEMRERFSLKDSDKVLLFIGKLSTIKRCSFLLDVFKEVAKKNRDAKLLIAGDGELKSDLIEKTIKYNLKERVFLLGNVNNIPELLSCSDVLVIPSLYEGFPYAALEGSANGIPVVIHNKMPFKNTKFPNLVLSDAESLETFTESVISSLTLGRYTFSLGDFALKSVVDKIANIYKNSENK